jgi:serine protease Do
MPKKKGNLTFLKNNNAIVVIVALLAGFIGGLIGWYLTNTVLEGESSGTVFTVSGEGTIADVVENVGDSIVSITVSGTEVVNSFIFGQRELATQIEGTGFVVSDYGLVVTNKHVVEAANGDISVYNSAGKEYSDVEIVAEDPLNDIAYLRVIDPSGLKSLKLGDSSKVRVGDDVIAIGNALGQFDNTVTRGIISGAGRPLSGLNATTDTLLNLFQTDAAINEGNSGGPLLNLAGEVIGINTAIAGGENLGFAIPINDIKVGIDSINETGKLERPYLGVRFITLNAAIADALKLDVDHGALIHGQEGVSAVIDRSPADKAGLVKDDIILEIDGIEVNEENQLSGILNAYKVGDTAKLKVWREGKEIEINIKLEAAPDTIE